jgi:hypothetical protein
MDQIPSSNQAGASNAPSRPTYNNGTGYQNNNQVSQRPDVTSNPSAGNVNQDATQPATTPVTTERTDWVRFNTICNRELVDKVRAIADRNHSSIRDVVELMFRRCINAYEQKNGVITIEKKKPLEELF